MSTIIVLTSDSLSEAPAAAKIAHWGLQAARL